MNQKIKEVMSKVPTDVSGKWMSVENVKSFAEILIIECAKIAKQEQEFYDTHNDGVVNSEIDTLIKDCFGIKT